MDLHEQDIRGRFVAHQFYAELEKIAAAMGMESQPGMMEAAQPGGVVLPEEAPPAHGIVGVNLQQYDTKHAHSTPILQAPPGYVYAPELSAFVPDQSDPGWMPPAIAAKAQENKGWYDQGTQDVTTAKAQQELDETAAANADAAAADAQQQAMAQQSQAVAQEQGMIETAKEQARMAANPAHAVKAKPKEPAKKPAAKKEEGGKGVVIRIGK